MNLYMPPKTEQNSAPRLWAGNPARFFICKWIFFSTQSRCRDASDRRLSRPHHSPTARATALPPPPRVGGCAPRAAARCAALRAGACGNPQRQWQRGRDTTALLVRQRANRNTWVAMGAQRVQRFEMIQRGDRKSRASCTVGPARLGNAARNYNGRRERARTALSMAYAR